MSSQQQFLLHAIFLLSFSLSKPCLANRFIPNQQTCITTKNLSSIKIPLKRIIHKPTPSISIGYTTDVGFHTQEVAYYTDISIGNPPTTFSLLIDTGSHLSWVRSCREGTCYGGKHFYPKDSNSFYLLPYECEELGKECNEESDECEEHGKECNEDHGCSFELKYVDETNATGMLSKETFTIWEDKSIKTTQILGVPLGCAFANTALKNLDGILGLGAHPASFASVLEIDYGIDKFSYCLLDQIDDPDETSSMWFGEQDFSTQVFYTPKLPEHIQHYAVRLLGISIEGEYVGESAFPLALIIDSGATVTTFPHVVYTQLRSKYKRVAARLGWVRATNLKGMVCYGNVNDVGELEDTPSMTLHFDGEKADLELKPHNIWRYFREHKAACLGFDDGTSIGNYSLTGSVQQQNIRVIFEGGDALRIGFDPSGC
ncbi:aspartic proteinase CDR1-like [Papaver somniferum]|uniref:aspartic proteinase CDR1-like n=1 Tax=Papaver somniferum TaxID=3469 RepID=UPI000E703C3A|nr:aspartic proteinase CDR1-like [Papaver somniferum]